MRSVILKAFGLAAISIFVMGGQPVLAKDDAKAKSKASETAPVKDAWTTRCEKVKLDPKQPETQYCETFQSLSVIKKDKDGKESVAQRLTEFAIGYPPGQKKARGVLIVPLGTLVEEPMSLTIDGKNDVSFRVRYCTPQGCFAFMNIPDSVLDKMSKGSKLSVKAKSHIGQNVEILMSLSGFGKALAKVRPKE